MAKILFGAGVADARNKLGGHVFTKNRNGAVLRMKVSPTQPRSQAQLNVRSQFAANSKSWGMDLIDSQRAAWAALAATNPVVDQFGNPQVLTGAQFYQRVNRNLQTISQPRMLDAPIDQIVEPLTSVSLSAVVSGNVLEITFTPQTLDPNMHLVAFLTPPLSPGRTFFTPFLKLVAADPADQTGSPFDAFALYEGIFGNLQETQKLGVSAFTINDLNGAASIPQTAVTLIQL